ncbi:MAG: hypothetical protein GC139_02495 [Sideroxydans sp.]|nr:hypothetical protein [Sideroxydans sp.]
MPSIAFRFIFVFLLSALVAEIANADEDYRCTINRVSLAGDESGANFKLLQTYIGKEFTVERRTGLMAGALKNSYVTKPQVVDYGSAANSYKVVTTMRMAEGAGYGSNIYALTINEYEKSLKKPFVFLSNDEIYFGSCTHF